MHRTVFHVAIAAALLIAGSAVGCSHEKGSSAKMVAAGDLPAAVSDAMKTRFPTGALKSAEREVEEGKVIYDLELTQDSRKFEMDIKEDGTVLEIEKQIAASDVPGAVSRSVAAKYPGTTIKEVMEVNKVHGKQETPDHYEVVLGGAKEKELVVNKDGTIQEESGEEK